MNRRSVKTIETAGNRRRRADRGDGRSVPAAVAAYQSITPPDSIPASAARLSSDGARPIGIAGGPIVKA